MAKVALAGEMKEEPGLGSAGPYVTISRQFGCWGFSLGLLLLEILNDTVDQERAWRIYHKEILDRLATETNTATDVLEKQRRAKPRMLAQFFQSLSGHRVPSGYAIRNRMTAIIRQLAMDGCAIVVGQGGAGATQELPNGLSVRLEAPQEWRLKQIAFREGISEVAARQLMQEREQEREYLRKIYETRFSRYPAFSLVYDCSQFTLAQIAQQIVYAMKLKGII